MAVSIQQLIEGQFLGSAEATLYTSATGVRTRVDSLSVCNSGASAATVTIYLVPAGQSYGAANMIVNAQAVLPGQTWADPYTTGKVLMPGDALVALASAASTLSISAAGTLMA